MRCAAILPSRNEANTVRQVAEQVCAALGDQLSCIILTDASSDEKTIEAFEQASINVPSLVIRSGEPGKGRQIISALRAVDADCYLLTDTDLLGSYAELYRSLFSRVQCGATISLAGYRRYWFEANLTNHIARPLIWAAGGVDVVQPLAGDICLSRSLRDRIISEWETLGRALQFCAAGYGIDAFIISLAIKEGAEIASVPEQQPKRHAPSFPHFRSIFNEAVPVLWQVLPRGMHNSMWAGTYEVFEADRDIRGLAQELTSMRGKGQSGALPDLLGRLFRERNDLRATEDIRNVLWPSYVDWTIRYLDVGYREGAPGANKFLNEAMRRFIGMMND